MEEFLKDTITIAMSRLQLIDGVKEVLRVVGTVFQYRMLMLFGNKMPETVRRF